MEIITYHLKDLQYRTPEPYIDANGEVNIIYSGRPIQVAPISFLYKVDIDKDGNILSAQGIDVVNSYLLYLKINRQKECVSTESRALLHYFSFLEDEDDLYEDEMAWDKMPFRVSSRPTYRFKKYLESSFKTINDEDKLARSTSKAYMRAVVNFYKFYIMIGHHFDNIPFTYETVNVTIKNKHNRMNPVGNRQVLTTDLRLKLSTEQKEPVPRPLQALSHRQWDLISEIIRRHRKVLVKKHDKLILTSLPIEWTYVYLLMRYSGLRRDEVLTLRECHAFEPTKEQLINGYVNINISPSSGVHTKNSKSRNIEMPSILMSKLYEYKNSKRRNSRLKKIIDIEEFGQYLFVNVAGKRLTSSSLNSRWSEIRNTYSKLSGESLEHKPHNLRASYAVERLRSLISKGISVDTALSKVQAHLGHDDIQVTYMYLKQAEENISAHEIYEHAIDYIMDSKEFKIEGVA